MPLTSAYAAGFRARTKVYRGNVECRMVLFDSDIGGLVDAGVVRSFEITNAPPSAGSQARILQIAEDSSATAMKLTNCQFTIDGQLWKVTARAEPIGSNKRLWKFTIEHSGDPL